MHTLPADIREGMDVYDSTGARIGKVEDFMASDEDPATPAPEVVDVGDADRVPQGDLAHILARAFAPDDALPREVQEKLLREGFVRIDAAGLFAADRYITPDQIASASEDRLTLTVPRDALIKRG